MNRKNTTDFLISRANKKEKLIAKLEKKTGKKIAMDKLDIDKARVILENLKDNKKTGNAIAGGSIDCQYIPKKIGFWLSLYGDSEYTKKEKHIEKIYNNINWYVKQYKKEVFNTAKNPLTTWNVDNKGQKMDWKELYKIKLDNIEVYHTNILLKLSWKLEAWIVPLRNSKQQEARAKKNIKKFSSQGVVNNWVNLKMHWLTTETPLDYIEKKYQKEVLKNKVIENKDIVYRIQKINKEIVKARKENKNRQNLYNEKNYLEQEFNEKIISPIR